jgi:hypothetical protein
MAYTANGAVIDAAMAHAPSSAAKTAFVTDVKAVQTEIQTQVATYPESVACQIEAKLVEFASFLASNLPAS